MTTLNFFHMIANGKHRKKKIIQLEQDEGTVVGHENLKLYISNYYKQLFGPPVDNIVSLDELVVEDISQLRLTSTRVNYFALVGQKRNKIIVDNCSVVNWGHCLSII